MNQVFLGAAIPFCVLAAFYVLRKGRVGFRFLLAAPLVVAAGTLWAIAPDILRLFGVWSPSMRALYDRLALDPRMNIFFWHYTIDQIETDTLPYHISVALMAIALLAAAWATVRRLEEDAP
jgi:hypothetical protein